jgi:lysophospholipase L1-like esterase
LSDNLQRAAIYVHPRERLHDLHSLFLSRLYSKPLIHVIGDSHIFSFRGINLFIIHPIGPATAYNLHSRSSTTKSNAKLWRILRKINKKRDIVVLVFGEIDSRIHIYNQYMKQRTEISIPQLIDKTIQNYDRVLQLIEKEGFSFFIYGIPPAAREENIYHFPFYADEETRILISREFNEKLKNFCRRKNYRYLDIQSRFANSSGFISQAFAADKVHLNEAAAVIIAEEILLRSITQTS